MLPPEPTPVDSSHQCYILVDGQIVRFDTASEEMVATLLAKHQIQKISLQSAGVNLTTRSWLGSRKVFRRYAKGYRGIIFGRAGDLVCPEPLYQRWSRTLRLRALELMAVTLIISAGVIQASATPQSRFTPPLENPPPPPRIKTIETPSTPAALPMIPPNNDEPQLRQARQFYLKGDFAKATPLFEDLVKRHQNRLAKTYLAEIQYALCSRMLKQGNPVLALIHCQDALELNHQHPEAIQLRDDIIDRAKDIFMEGYILEQMQPQKAAEKYREVRQRLEPVKSNSNLNHYYKRASQRLKAEPALP